MPVADVLGTATLPARGRFRRAASHATLELMRDSAAKPPRRREPRPLPQPDAANLRDAALSHLARYAATEIGLARVLQRRVDRWARQSAGDSELVGRVVGEARAVIAGLVKRLAGSGAVDDAAFAQTRARSLARAGRSRRAIGAHLSSRGVPGTLAGTASAADPEQELAAALIHARKRRLGPWRRAEPSPELRRKELANLARAGFGHGLASAALAMEAEEAESRIIAFRDAL